MTECAVRSCNSTELVFSGIDAFMLGGIPTEKYCYTCANTYVQIADSLKLEHTHNAT